MGKKIDLSRTVYDLTTQYPELIEVLAGLGLTDIKKKFLRNSVGKLITIPKGAGMHGIEMKAVIDALEQQGFEVVGAGKPTMSAETLRPVAENTRTEQLKGYLRRLGTGESLEAVRKDFANEFGDVEASEIMQAEQELLAEGTPLHEVQQLCDIHSALFHGATREERIANAEQEVAASVSRHGDIHAMAQANTQRAVDLSHIDGHPIQMFLRENAALEALLKQAFEVLETRGDITELLLRIRELSIHYAKKGDLLYPHLKVKYDISGPSQVMWTIDDEIRHELGILTRKGEHDELWWGRVGAVLNRAKEMIYKENNILLPLCAANFTETEWQQIYRDSKDYAVCLGVEPEIWSQAASETTATKAHEGEIIMPGGHLTLAQLTAMLNTLPLEITFVDADNINRYFNEGPKVFKRPFMAIDREVFSCHPPKIEPMVRSIIEDLRSGKRSQVPMWVEKCGHPMFVNYMAVRDDEGNYVGTVEVVQDMEFAKKHFQR